MGFRIEPMESEAPALQRRPRQKAEKHLIAIRDLPCLRCGARAGIEAAHIRTGSRKHGKRETGFAEKPSDIWTLPLCNVCHRAGPKAQHSGNEMEFYRKLGIDPFATALALWAASGDAGLMQLIIAEARQQ